MNGATSFDTQQLCGEIGQPPFENEPARDLARAPQIRYLQKCLMIRVALVQRRGVPITAQNFGADVLAVIGKFGGAEYAANFDEAVAFVR